MRHLGLGFVLGIGLAACGGAAGEDEQELPPELDGVDESAWLDSELACESDDDCASSESCIDRLCQMERCTAGPYASDPPLGGEHTFFADRELVAADGTAEEGSYWIDGYETAGGGAEASGAWELDDPIVDLDGGRLLGDGSERLVAAVKGSTALHIAGEGAPSPIEIGFSPIAVAVADTDRDGVDEIAAIAGDGRFALCQADEGSCITRKLKDDDFSGDDVAAADVDADGYAEVVFLAKLSSQRAVVWNPHHEITGEKPRYRTKLEEDYHKIAAGDLDGDGVSEIVALKHGDPVDVLADQAHIYAWGGESFARAGSQKVGRKAIDLTVADLDRSGGEELVVLRSTGQIEHYVADGGPGSLQSSGTGNPGASGSPERIATADIDGDSSSARVVAEPELVRGPMVPMVVLNFPPYLEGASDGTSIVAVGQSDKTSESYSDSVSLGVGVEFGVEAGINGLFASSLKTGVDREVSYTASQSTQKAVGTRFSIAAKPDAHEDSYGVVLLSSGCFHGYTYELSDPAGYLDEEGQSGDGGRFFGMVPVGGEHTVWSTVRYNELAKVLGSLPVIEVGTELGVPESYPEEPRRLDGSPVPEEDMVFPNPPQFAVSDIGNVGWRLTSSQTESQTEAMSQDLSVSTSVNVGGLDGAGEVSRGTGKSYSL